MATELRMKDCFCDAGAAVVNAIGPLRKVVQGGAAGPRRRLVIAANVDDKPGAPLQVQRN